MSSANDLPDGELAARTLEGQEAAFREILRRYREKILAVCLRMLRNRTEAEEAAQECFVKAYYHLSGFDRTRDLAAWLAAIAINECRDRLRQRTRTRGVFREISDAERDAVHSPRDENFERESRVRDIEEAVEKLPVKLKEVLILRAHADYSYEQIAAILKIEIGTVMSRLHRARAKLTEFLKRGD